MLRNLAVLATLLLLAASTRGEDAPRQVSRHALHFRLAVGAETVRTIPVRIDESGGAGTGYDRLVADLDGDGRAEVVPRPAYRRCPGLEEQPVWFQFSIGDHDHVIDLGWIDSRTPDLRP